MPRSFLGLGDVMRFDRAQTIGYHGSPMDMDRRDFLKTTGTMFAATVLPASTVSAAERIMPGRVILPLNRGWRYHPGVVAGAETQDFDDSGFERVVIPHTNVRLNWHNFDDKEYEFVSTYRRRFGTPEAAKGKRVFVDFEGGMTASTVRFGCGLCRRYTWTISLRMLRMC